MGNHEAAAAVGQTQAIPPSPLSAHEWQEVVAALQLTPQQARIVDLILRGLRDKQIAAALDVRVATVRTHLRLIFARHEISDRVELVLRVFAVGRDKEARERHTQL